MLRIISSQGISAVKTKVGSQMSHVATRPPTISNFNLSSRRFNSSTIQNFDQDLLLKPQGITNNSASAGAAPTISTASTSPIINERRNKNKRASSNNNRRNYNNNHNNNKKNYTPDIPQGKDNPWFHQLVAFDEAVSNTYFSNSPHQQNNDFWDSLTRSVELYSQLAGTPDFIPERVASMIYLLHTGLRQNRKLTLKLDKKPDFDATNFHKDMMDYICVSLRKIASDIISKKVVVNQYGAMHLITSFKELQLYDEAISIWENATMSSEQPNSSNDAVSKIWLDPRVVGVILPLLYTKYQDFLQVKDLFEKSRSTQLQSSLCHPNLGAGMIKTCLLAGEINFALQLFEELCSVSNVKNFGYLTEIHLTFIGECSDLSVANTFFEKALNDEMPYHVDLQVPYVKSFMINTWNQTKDFEQVLNIWVRCWKNYGTSVTKGVSSALNDLFLTIFFKNFENDKVLGFENLKKIISIYANIKPLDEPFLNIVMTKCVVWQDYQIINEIINYYELYNVAKTQVAYRVALKALGSVTTTDQDIINKWNELLIFSDYQGSTFIHKADWAALRDSTVASKFTDRVLLYAKLVKIYSIYSKNITQIKLLTEITAAKFPFAAPILNSLDTVDASDISVASFRNIKALK